MKPHQEKALRGLNDAHIGSLDIVSINVARKLANASFISHRLVGILVDRKGTVRWVVVGDATRLYLPDIGRIRGGVDRLRGLRLIVARPTPHSVALKIPTLSHDFKTDLEKLRLDMVVEIDASRENVDGPFVLGYLAREEEGQATTTKIDYFRSIHDVKETFVDLMSRITDDLRQISSSRAEKTSDNFLEKAILVGVYPHQSKKQGQSSMAELHELARSARVKVIDKVFQWRPKYYPKTVIGPGKLEEICLHALSQNVEMLIFDQDLSPSQLMHITDLTDLKVLDRTMLILDIFAQRAVTREGKLQVEMAQLTYSLPRLFEKQTGLSRLTGGIGGRGPGETKLEVNRRRVRERMSRLNDELRKIKTQRELRRKVRKTNHLPTLAILGYTNAGKSTLLNALSGSHIYAKDELFATLDPHSRRLRFPSDQEVVVTDTVGFINHLPESLMRAFMATLEELNDADVLIHVADISNDDYMQQIKVVLDVLKELGTVSEKPIILALNKIDKLTEEELIDRKKNLRGIPISAHTGEGLTELLEEARKTLNGDHSVSPEKSEKMLPPTGEEVVFDERLVAKPRFTKPN